MILGADLVLIDDRKGAAAAREMGFEVAGTLGLLSPVPAYGNSHTFLLVPVLTVPSFS